MKDFIESNIFYKRCNNHTMNGKMIIIAVTVAMLSFSLSACGKLWRYTGSLRGFR